MKPRISAREAFIVAGVTGSGNETGKAWDAFMKLNKLNPLTNKTGEEGYEIRMYPLEGLGEVHVGLETQPKSPKSPKYQHFSGTIRMPIFGKTVVFG